MAGATAAPRTFPFAGHRTVSEVEAARIAGRKAQSAEVRALVRSGLSVSDAAKLLGIAESTAFKRLAQSFDDARREEAEGQSIVVQHNQTVAREA